MITFSPPLEGAGVASIIFQHKKDIIVINCEAPENTESLQGPALFVEICKGVQVSDTPKA